MDILETGRRVLRRSFASLARIDRGGADRGVPRRDGPRIAVIGNCQARGVARALQVLLPDAQVQLLSAGALGRKRPALQAFADGLREFDHVFAQPLPAGTFRDGDPAELPGLLRRIRLFPAVVFAAFHPDMIYVGNSGAGGGLVPSPLHTYHSAIVLFGHLHGLSKERIAGLFRGDVFSALGYLDGWASSAEDLTRSSSSIGFDLGSDLTRWARRGAFMHGINHPTLPVLADIAARLAREAGLAPADLAVDAYLVDDLLDEVIWPVYPPVAEAYGLIGSYTFKRRNAPKAPPPVLDLEGLIGESLALYRRSPTARLSCLRTEHWAGTPEIRRLFDGA